MSKSKGFTLIEITIVLIIFSILIGAAFSLLKVYTREAQEAKEAQKLYDIRVGIAEFMQDTPDIDDPNRFPCPASLKFGTSQAKFGVEHCENLHADMNGDGVLDVLELSSPGGAAITEAELGGLGDPDNDGVFVAKGANGGFVLIGTVPTRTIGIASENASDTYGNRRIYGVSVNHVIDDDLYTASSVSPPGLIRSLNQIETFDVADPFPPGGTYQSFVLLSTGPNAVGAYNYSSGVQIRDCPDAEAGVENGDTRNCRWQDDKNAVFRDRTEGYDLVDSGDGSYYDDSITFSLAAAVGGEEGWWYRPPGVTNYITNKNGDTVTVIDSTAVTNAGHVGIGTNEPSHPLTIDMRRGSSPATHSALLRLIRRYSAPGADGIATGIRFEVPNNAGTSINSGHIFSGLADVTAGSELGFTAIRAYDQVLGQSLEKMRVMGNGNVGIGTTDPASELHVFKSGAASVIKIATDALGSGQARDGELHFDRSGSNVWRIVHQTNDAVGNDGNPNGLDFKKATTGATVLSFLGGPKNDVIITDPRNGYEGNVGIGTAEPGGNLTISAVRADSGGGHLHIRREGGSDNQAVMIFGDWAGGIFDQHAVIGLRSDLETLPTNYPNSQDDLFIDNDDGRIIMQTRTAGKDIILHPNGNVGIGTTAPSAKLHVADTGSVIFERNGAGLAIDPNNLGAASDVQFMVRHGIQFYTSADNYGSVSVASALPAMLIDEDGDVGIGTSSPGAPLEVFATATSGKGSVYVKTTDIDAGVVLDATNSAGDWRLVAEQENTNFIIGYNTGSTTTKLRIETDGDVWIPGDLTENSDKRLKDDVEELPGLQLVDQLSGYSYVWNKNAGPKQGQRDTGVIAQELQAIPELAHLVHGTEGDLEKGETLSVNYNGLIPVLIEAVKELKAEKDALQKQNEQLAAKNKEQDDRLALLESKLSPAHGGFDVGWMFALVLLVGSGAYVLRKQRV